MNLRFLHPIGEEIYVREINLLPLNFTNYLRTEIGESFEAIVKRLR